MARLAAGRVAVLAVGFDPPAALAPVAEHLGWPGAFLADEERILHRRLGMHRAPPWRIWSPRTLAWYRRARRAGVEAAPTDPAPPVDVRQMGGDAVVLDGVAVRRWLPRTPVDRVEPAEVVRVAVTLAGGQTESM